MDALPDRDLIVRARRGDTGAFGELVRRTQATVFNVCLRLLGEQREAEDLTQQTFLRAWERLHTFDSERPFAPWIRRVAANLCLNHLSANHAAFADLAEELDEDISMPGPAQVVEQRQQSEIIRTALLALPPRYRIVIELKHFQEMSYEEIAGFLGRPLSDVKSDLFRARKMLAGKIKNDPSFR